MPGIGFFAPLPLALMMPFMAGQSMLMGDAFGKSYQYGKRKISSMSNEEFNKLTAEDLGKSVVSDYTAIIPSLKQAVAQSQDFQSLIIQEMTKIARSIPSDVATGLTSGNTNPVESLVNQSQNAIQGDPIDYGKIAIAVIKNLLGPIGSNLSLPSVQTAYADTTTTTRNTSVQGPIDARNPAPTAQQIQTQTRNTALEKSQYLKGQSPFTINIKYFKYRFTGRHTTINGKRIDNKTYDGKLSARYSGTLTKHKQNIKELRAKATLYGQPRYQGARSSYKLEQAKLLSQVKAYSLAIKTKLGIYI